MAALAIVAVTLGLDSARASATLALTESARARVRLALAFGAFDGAASLAGLLAGGSILATLEPRLRVAGALALACYGAWLALDIEKKPRVPPSTWIVVPAALSLDNVGAGIALAGSGTSPYLLAALLGSTSCLLAGAGFALGGLVRPRLPVSPARLGGLALLAIAVSQGVGAG
jgi:putative Mn2+ efflux pump MntP